MIDHVLGRPSVRFRKTQVFAVIAFWSLYLWKGDRNGPPGIRNISKRLSRTFTTWQTVVLTLVYLYVTRNFGKVVGLECPEPLANLYTRSYFRATWVTTALDAGFWTAMYIRPRWFRDLCSVTFTMYYLICAEQADEKVRKVRGALTLQHLRVSWNKPTTPYLWTLTGLLRPRVGKHRFGPRELRIPRPSQSSYKETVHAWLYFDGPLSELAEHDKIVLDVPGGGFVSMNPRCHEDKLLGWAGRTGVPVIAIDYKKAPEYPYPYAINECYDVYHAIIQSRGRCVGLSGQYPPKIVVSGDSAGGNIAVAMILMLLQTGSSDQRRHFGQKPLPPPEGLILIYPALDMNIGSWMTDEQMNLIKDRKTRRENLGVVRRKSDHYRHLTPDTPTGSDDEEEYGETASKRDKLRSKAAFTSAAGPADAAGTAMPHTVNAAAIKTADVKPAPMKTRLAMSSIISYFNDRILTPEMLRAMVILYVGPHSRPDLSTDFLLSPILAPDELLGRFPKTCFMTGERDPLVDDTVIFAGRLRQAKRAQFQMRKELGLVSSKEEFDETDWVNVALVPSISHGFLQFVSVYPEGWTHIFRCAKWMVDMFNESMQRDYDAAKVAQETAEKQQNSRRKLRINCQAEYADGRTPSAPSTGSSREGALFGQDRREGDDNDDEAVVEEDDDDQEASRRGDEDDHQAEVTEARPRHHQRARTISSGDEDKPLEMTAIRSPSLRANGGGSSFGSRKRAGTTGKLPNIILGGSSTSTSNSSARDAKRGPASAGMVLGSAGKAPRDTPDSSSSLSGAAAAAMAVARRERKSRGTRVGDEGGEEDEDDCYDSSEEAAAAEAARLRLRKAKSLVALASSDDLLVRRMDGVAGGLLGRIMDSEELAS